MPFATLSEIPGRHLFPGATGHYTHAEKLTLGEVAVAAGAIVPTHQHPHEQITYVLQGCVEFTIGIEARVLEAGTCAVVPGGTPHGCRALTASRVKVVFVPSNLSLSSFS